MWWPNGFGAQQLYQLNITMVVPSVAEDVLKSVKVGFRTVELVQEPLKNNTAGLSFFFRVRVNCGVRFDLR